MKRIVMWMGSATNEGAWAGILSSFGEVFLVRCGKRREDSIWSAGRQIFLGAKKPVTRWRWLDNLFLGFFSAFGIMRQTLKWAQGKPIALLIVEGPRGLLAVWLKRLGKVRALVSLQSDYLPPAGKLHVRLHRRANMALNRFIGRNADELWKLSPRIPTGEGHPQTHVIPVYINDNKVPPTQRRDVMYFGVPSPDHALDVLFEIARRHDIPLHIVGDSPYLDSIKSSATPRTIFHGYIEPEQLAEIARQCYCGYAVYRNTSPQNYSYYGFPSKYFHYLANNVPVLTTNTAFFSQDIEKNGVGRVVSPEPRQIEQAILEMRDHSADFDQAINRFRKEWNRGVENFLAGRMAGLLK
jgi:glycosyltransferase involved in cell wall biosynthesis